MRIRQLATTVIGVFSIAATMAATPNYERQIDELLSKMTLEEKIGQLNQLSGQGLSPNMVGQVKAGMIGSILNEIDPAVVNELQRVAVEESRLGIPLVMARDVIHGFKTIFPIPLGQSATWNPELVKKGARIAADEATSVGIRWTFSPMLDVSRDARWGRIAESFGEDPFLVSVMGQAMIEGYQGDDLRRPTSMAACAKHFAGYGFSEAGLDYSTTFIPEGLLRDVVLQPFKTAAESGAATFMCSFNDINGVPSNGNKRLLRDVLRGEWGYDGMVVSDWGSIGQMIAQGVCADLPEAARKSIESGVDMDMESYAYTQHLKKLVESGQVSERELDDAVRNVLRLKYRLGLFDNPYVDVTNSRRFYRKENLAAATQAVEESAILLKNTGNLLPLSKGLKIAVVGPMADAAHDQNGTWCFDLEAGQSVTPLTSMQQTFGDNNIIYAPGLAYSRDRSTEGFDEAVKAAEQADVVVAFVGEEAVLSGEAHCRTDITLPGAQAELLQALKAVGKPMVMVVMAGRPLAIAPETELSDAVIYAYHGGTMTGPGLANVISGKANPSGHLTNEMPRMSGQVPIYYAKNRSGRPASDIVLIDEIELEAGQTSTGCTSFYLDAGDGPLYPFGYGLSYTTFDISSPRLSTTAMDADGQLTASVTVKNTGNREGAQVVQLYVGDKVASLVRPKKELKGFRKVTLQPGESRTIDFAVNASDLGFHLADGTYVVEPGDFDLWIAADAASGQPVTFTIR